MDQTHPQLSSWPVFTLMINDVAILLAETEDSTDKKTIAERHKYGQSRSNES